MVVRRSMAASLLIADDELNIRELLRRGFKQCGYEVTLAADGTEALEHLRKTEFDLVFTDIRMPGVDGIAVLKAAKDLSPAIEVVVATAFADLDTAVACVRGGAFDFVYKPFNIDDVQATVARALERRELRAANALYRAS